MERERFLEAIDGLWAYDTGAVDSGIHDNLLKKEVISFLHNEPELSTQWLSEYAHHLLSESHYTIRDVASLIDWLGQEMEWKNSSKWWGDRSLY